MSCRGIGATCSPRPVALRYPVFVEHRGVVAPAWRVDESNIDHCLERDADPDRVTEALCHLHLRDLIVSTSDEVVLGRLARSIEGRWKAALEAQFPQRTFEAGVSGESSEQGPSV